MDKWGSSTWRPGHGRFNGSLDISPSLDGRQHESAISSQSMLKLGFQSMSQLIYYVGLLPAGRSKQYSTSLHRSLHPKILAMSYPMSQCRPDANDLGDAAIPSIGQQAIMTLFHRPKASISRNCTAVPAKQDRERALHCHPRQNPRAPTFSRTPRLWTTDKGTENVPPIVSHVYFQPLAATVASTGFLWQNARTVDRHPGSSSCPAKRTNLPINLR